MKEQDAAHSFEKGSKKVMIVSDKMTFADKILNQNKNMAFTHQDEVNKLKDELTRLRSELQQEREKAKETSILDLNGKMIMEGDRVMERQLDFNKELGYIDVYYRVEWSRWCYGLFIYDKWIKPLDTITARGLEISETT